MDYFFSVNLGEEEFGKQQGEKNTILETGTKTAIESFGPKILLYNEEPLGERNPEENFTPGQYQNLYNLFLRFEEYRLSTGKKYDLMIRTRFDNEIASCPEFSRYAGEANRIFIPRGFFYGMSGDLKRRWKGELKFNEGNKTEISKELDGNYIINDRFAIGNYKSMARYFQFGEYELRTHREMEKISGFRSTEGALSYHLKASKIQIECDLDLVTKLIRV